MSAHAEFAVVLGIDRTIFNDSLKSSYLEGRIQNQFNFSAGIPGFLEYIFNLFGDIPTIEFSSAYVLDFIITFKSWGELTISSLTSSTSRGVGITITMKIPHDAILENCGKNIRINLDTTNLIVTSFVIEVLNGDQFSNTENDFHNSNIFLNLVTDSLRQQLSGLGEKLPSIDISFLDSFLVFPATTEDELEKVITARCLDGVFNIGIDLEVVGSNSGTAGNPYQFENINNGLSIGIVCNSNLWIPTLRQQLLEGDQELGITGLVEHINNAGASLNTFELSMQLGCIHGILKIDSNYGFVSTSFDVVPYLERPATYTDLGYDELGYPCIIRTPAREELWFKTENINVDIQLVWWISFINIVFGIITSGIVVLIINSIRNMFQFNIEAVLSQPNNLAFNLGQIKGKLERFNFYPDSIRIGISVQTEFPNPCIYPSWSYPYYNNSLSIPVDSLFYENDLRFTLKLPCTAHIDDPYLHIAWTVRRILDNSIIISEDDKNLEITLPKITDTKSALLIQCRVYRSLWNPPIELYYGTYRIEFFDKIDQSHPYVRWSHYVGTPFIKIGSNGKLIQEGYQIKYRHSKIHRTDFPQRCRMVAKYSLSVPRGFKYPSSNPPKIEYLDSLPFSIEEIQNHRDDICEYCFFGGPNKATLKSLSEN